VYSIARTTAEGAEVSGHSIILTAGASASASITLVQGSIEVEGTVKKAGKGFAGAMVVLVPKNPAIFFAEIRATSMAHSACTQ
jgi:hypothetical protein